MKTKSFLLSILIIVGIIAVIQLAQTFAAPPVTPVGSFSITITLSTNTAAGLDAALANYNAKFTGTNINPISGTTNAASAIQYMTTRMTEVVGSYAAKNDGDRRAKLISDFDKATEAKKQATENAAK